MHDQTRQQRWPHCRLFGLAVAILAPLLAVAPSAMASPADVPTNLHVAQMTPSSLGFAWDAAQPLHWGERVSFSGPAPAWGGGNYDNSSDHPSTLSDNRTQLVCGSSYTISVAWIDDPNEPAGPAATLQASTLPCTKPPPAAPAGLVGTLAETDVSFDWDTAPADVVAAHYTYQGLGVSRDSVVGADDTFFDPGTVVCGETYTIAVAWLDDEGQWGPSSNASGTALDCNPFGPGPTGLRVTAATTIRLTYAWDAYGGPGIWFVRATAAGGAGYASHSRGALSASTGGLRCSTQYVISVQWVFIDGTVSEPSSVSVPTADCPPPHVSTGGATNVTTDSAVLTGFVDPNGLSTSYHFEWGATTDYGSSTAPQDAGVGTTSTAVVAGVSGLQQATVYHYRLAATSSSG